MKLVRALVFVLLSSFWFIVAPSVQASLVVIDKEGRVVINVLSAEESIELEIPRSEFLEIKNVVSETPEEDAKISLAKVNGKATLEVSSPSGNKSLDVTNYNKEVIEIEERPEVQKLTISVSGDKFIIGQRNVFAETDYQINIDPQTARLTLETPSGLRFLSILPRQATDSVLRAKYINRIESERNLVIKEEGSDLTYEVFGDKVLNFFNFFEYPIPVSVQVSASTGEILYVDQPIWLKVINFLFV